MKETLLYGGRVAVRFHSKGHRYTISVPERGLVDITQPSVTTVLGTLEKSGPLIGWAVKQCRLYGEAALRQEQDLTREGFAKILTDMTKHWRTVKQQAADVGTAVHDYLHAYLKAKVDKESVDIPRPKFQDEEMDAAVNRAIGAGLDFFDVHHLIPLRMEAPVWSAKYGYIGMDDFIGFVDGELSVIDYKTSKDIYPEVWLQTAAYQAAYEEEHPDLRIQTRWAVNVRKTGELVAAKRNMFERDFRAFLCLLDAWEWRQTQIEGKEPTVVVGSLLSEKGESWHEGDTDIAPGGNDEVQAEAEVPAW
jgi:hypothetical protein